VTNPSSTGTDQRRPDLVAPPPVLEVRGLRTDIRLKRSTVRAVDGVDLTVYPGQTFGLVGESGCGKTMTALSIMNLLPPGGHVVDGSIRLGSTDLLQLDEAEMRHVRGNDIGMVFQDPLTSLNPTQTVGRQIAEAVLLHRDTSHAAARRRGELGMAVVLVTHDLGVVAGRADHVIVMYAGRIVERADTEQLFRRPRHRYTEALFGALPERAVEGMTRLHTIPGLPPDLTRTINGCGFAPRCRFAQDDCRIFDPPLADDGPSHRHACLHPVDPGDLLTVETLPATPSDLDGRDTDAILSVQDLVKDFPLGGAFFGRSRGTVSAVAGLSFEALRGQTLGLVGESGCGKTTTGRLLVGLETPTSGTVLVDGKDLSRLSGRSWRSLRREVQFMFQDSYASLDPRMKVGAILREPLVIQKIGTRAEQEQRVAELLDDVGLPRNAVERFPHEFSGGQRQRIGLARALSLRPELIVADEPVSALDVSIQAQVLNTMRDLQDTLSLTYVVISHNLSVIRYLADRIGVMYLGKLVEEGPAEAVYRHPRHPYTDSLIRAIPAPVPSASDVAPVPLAGQIPSALDPPSGCRFRTRCPHAQSLCATTEPALVGSDGDGHRFACHFPLDA